MHQRIKLYGNNTTNTKADACVSFVYAHGKLESILGHDVLVAEHRIQYNEGIFPVTVVDNDGNDRQCVAYVWEKFPGTNIKGGLVVLETDLEATRYAAKQFVEQAVLI